MKQKIAFLILRLGLGVVFLLFGVGKFRNDIWAQTIRTMDFFLKLPWDVNLSVLLIGSIETATGIALISGLFTRFFALAAAVQLAGILVLLKFQEFRDIGLLAAAIYLAMVRPESFGIDYLWKKRRDK
ncbi:MAG: DoxX family protein [Candidatus Omnitrophica bacterium]|nr:DoxX family protein [Candidatus Omnitrophota bacterium]MDD5610681.1 DoxX family protein [Candidatus Omnitrophota bacterium]